MEVPRRERQRSDSARRTWRTGTVGTGFSISSDCPTRGHGTLPDDHWNSKRTPPVSFPAVQPFGRPKALYSELPKPGSPPTGLPRRDDAVVRLSLLIEPPKRPQGCLRVR